MGSWLAWSVVAYEQCCTTRRLTCLTIGNDRQLIGADGMLFALISIPHECAGMQLCQFGLKTDFFADQLTRQSCSMIFT